MSFDNHSRAIFAVFGAQIIWGVAGPLVKIVLADIPPFGLMFLRFLFTTIILFIIFEIKFAKNQPAMTRQDIKDIFIAGFFGVFVNICLYFFGQNLTTVIDAWVIASTGTLFVIAYSFLFLGERLSKIIYFGVALAFAGTIIIVGTPILDIGSGSLLGNTLMLGSVLAGVIAFFSYKRLVAKFDPLVLAYYSFLISLPLSLPLFLWEYFQNPIWLANLSVQSLAILTYLVLGSGIAAYTLQGKGLIHLSPSLAATVGYTGAVISVGLSIIFLHEQPTKFFLIGTALVVFGLFLAETRHPSHPIHKIKIRK